MAKCGAARRLGNAARKHFLAQQFLDKTWLRGAQALRVCNGRHCGVIDRTCVCSVSAETSEFPQTPSGLVRLRNEIERNPIAIRAIAWTARSPLRSVEQPHIEGLLYER